MMFHALTMLICTLVVISTTVERELAISLHKKGLLVFFLVVVFAISAIGVASAEDTASVKASLSVDRTTITLGQTITFTCTYTSSANPKGTGKLSISESLENADDDPITMTSVRIWNGKTGSIYGPLLDSGVPVTYTKQFTEAGYYKVEWRCNYNGGGISADGAWIETVIHVVETPTVLPESPPLAALAASFMAIGVCIVVVKKKSAAVSTKLLP